MKHIEINHYAPPTDVKKIKEMLLELDPYIMPRLSGRVDIGSYATKIAKFADIFNLEIEGNVVGNLAIYLNSNEGFITSIAICPKYQRLGYGRKLWERAQEVAISRKITTIYLEVNKSNALALKFYFGLGFQIEMEKNNWIRMQKVLREGKKCQK